MAFLVKSGNHLAAVLRVRAVMAVHDLEDVHLDLEAPCARLGRHCDSGSVICRGADSKTRATGEEALVEERGKLRALALWEEEIGTGVERYGQ